MPQSGMDGWVIAGVLIAAIAALIAWRQLRGGGPRRTVNRVGQGHRNHQTGGQGQTENTVERGNDNRQGGA